MSTSKSEQSYTAQGLISNPPLRSDGRSLLDYRPICMSTGVYPQANGSAKVECGGSEVVVGVMCEIDHEGNEDHSFSANGRIKCNVLCTPSAYPAHSPPALDDLSYDLSVILSDVYSDPGLLPSNLVVVPGRKSWTIHIDALVTADGGNLLDVLFLAVRAALWNCRVPSTKNIEYKGSSQLGNESAFVTQHRTSHAADFEIKDFWEDGESLANRETFPIAITLNLLSSIHFLDATHLESMAAQSRLIFIYSFSQSTLEGNPTIRGIKYFGEAMPLKNVHTHMPVGQQTLLVLGGH
ncbi:ribosomal protein S5 domain 2-like protein [Sistotremastrum suecicum HHB10207 ss-3]|uniref:Ribosomal RNA-processing protein 42 n=1 Tax=Sistotremastrum suecicum HHB10207 ss-3 TaxID=1314776 RepID=A0A166I939_9AGAM|nr:ribosomal protein S5 domain 2-like protein [Sistotremastrum suecicum HHB10207 ss-3]